MSCARCSQFHTRAAANPFPNWFALPRSPVSRQSTGDHARKAEYIPPALRGRLGSPGAPEQGPVGYPTTRPFAVPENAQPVLPLRTWKLTLAYDGTPFRGWQVQPGERTVQGELQAALGRVTGESPLPQGSGRTDAGVHALGQVASFALSAPIPEENLRRALNRTLPPSIRILETRTARSAFHARHSALAKIYEYRVFRGEICPPFLARYVHACSWPMDVDALQPRPGSLRASTIF